MERREDRVNTKIRIIQIKRAWRQRVGNKSSEKKIRRRCAGCSKHLLIQQFDFLKTQPNKRDKLCKKCKGIINRLDPKKLPGELVKKNVLNVNPGEIVLSSGKLFFVSESFPRKVYKSDIAGFRIMDNGDILRRTMVDLGTNWWKIII